MSELNLIQQICIWVIPVVFAITVHEVAHGYVARMFGDSTAYMLGRLTLNPVKHVDPVGTLLVPGLLLMMKSGFLFGWAKPVPVSTRYFKHPRRDMAIVALAGPVANLAMALFWGLLLKLGLALGGQGLAQGLIYMGAAGIAINLVLMVLNLLPLPPLDGSRVLNGFLPESAARTVDRFEQYGLFLVVILLATGMLSRIMNPMLQAAQTGLMTILGLPSIRIF
ncbi:MAG: site-2 protease family protein [Nevskiales bacterium]